MDSETTTIIQAFQCILTGSSVQSAQQWLMDNLTNKGTCIKFLMIADNQQCSLQQRQLALTELSRAIKDHWNNKPNHKMITEEDKTTLKSNILTAIIRCQDQSLFKIYKQILYNLLSGGQDNWPTFPDEVFTKLQNSKSMEEVYGSLIAVQQLFAVHQVFTTDIQTTMMYKLQIKGFPIISNFAGQLLNSYNESTAHIVQAILKIYFHSINMELSDITASPQQLQSWLAFVKIIYDFKLPPNLADKSYMFKNRKLCGKIILLFISKHANKSYQKKQYNSHLPELFEQKYSVPFLESFIQTVYSEQHTSTDMYYSFKYIQYSLKFAKTFQVIYQHLEKILFDICLPLLQYTNNDQQQFHNDPQEFIRKEEDNNSYKSSNRNSMMELIEKICLQKDVNKNLIVNKLYANIYESLNKKVNLKTNEVLSNNEIDGYLFCIGRLKSQIMEKNYVENLLGLAVQEFQSSDPLVRARVCWLFSKFNDLEYQNPQIVRQAVQGVSQCIQEKTYLPIQVMAAIALDSLLEQKEAREILKPNLQAILTIYLEMMNKIECDELIDALDGIIEVFSEDIEPYAQVLIKSLIFSFNNFIQNSEKAPTQSSQSQKPKDDEEDEEDAVMDGAKNCLKAITKVLDAPLKDTTVQQLEYIIMPLIDSVFIQDSIQYIDEISNILNLLIYKSTVISEQLWFYFSVILYNITGIPEHFQQQLNQLNLQQTQMTIIQNIKQGLGFEYIEYFLSPLKNFLSKGSVQFQQRVDILGFKLPDIFMQMIAKVYNESSEVEKTQVSLLYIALLENYQGKIDNYLSTIIFNSLDRLGEAKQKEHKNLILLNLEIISVCIWNNPSLSIQLLESKDISQQYFMDLYNNQTNFKSDFEKQRILYGLASLLSIQGNIPQSLQPGLNTLVKWMTELTKEILELREKEENDDNNDSDISEEENQDFEYRKTVKALQQCQKDNTVEEADDDDEDFSPDRDIEANSFVYKYDSVLDQQDEILYFEQILKYLTVNNPQFYQSIMSGLNDNELNQLKLNFSKANFSWSQQNVNVN